MFEFQKPPQKVEPREGEPFKLHKDLNLFHNKMRIRKLITGLQNLFKNRVGIPLDAPAIQDSYFKAEYTNQSFILLCGELDKEKDINQIYEKYQDIKLNKEGFAIDINNEYIFLKSPSEAGYERGIAIISTIINQTMDKYFEEKDFDKYIQIPSLTILDGV